MKRQKRTLKSDKDYLSNSDFTNEIVNWINYNKENPNNKKPISEKLGLMLMKIINNYSKKRNYSGYSYLDEMKSEAIVTCLKYLHNFDIEKSSNGFSYVTQIIDNAFKIFLKKEKKQHDLKYDLLEEHQNFAQHNYKKIMIYDEDEI